MSLRKKLTTYKNETRNQDWCAMPVDAVIQAVIEEMPNKKNADLSYNYDETISNQGWNACLTEVKKRLRQ